MSYLLHLYVEVEDEADEKTFLAVIEDHEYPFVEGDTQGLPDTVEDLQAIMRNLENELYRPEEEPEDE